MNNKKIIKQIIYLISLSISFSCSSPSEPDSKNILTILEPPLITGFYVTTLEHPDGNGEIIGTPSYTVKEINVFPNPYSGTIINYPINPPGYREPVIYFNHLPYTDTSATILIIKGTSQQEANSSQNSSLGVSFVRSGVLKVRTIKKIGFGNFSQWDLKDENGNYVSSGYYRAYFYGTQIPENYYLDISVNLTIGDLLLY